MFRLVDSQTWLNSQSLCVQDLDAEALAVQPRLSHSEAATVYYNGSTGSKIQSTGLQSSTIWC